MSEEIIQWLLERVEVLEDQVKELSRQEKAAPLNGVSGRIPFFVTPTTFNTTAQFFWDMVNNRLGINQATPLASIHVTGTATSDNMLFRIDTTLANAYSNFQFGTNADVLWFGSGGTATGAFSGSLYIYAQNSGLIRFMLTNTGSLLLGNLTSGLTGNGDLDTPGNIRATTFRVGANQVVTSRQAGVGAALSTGGSETNTNIATRINQIMMALRTHGLIS